MLPPGPNGLLRTAIYFHSRRTGTLNIGGNGLRCKGLEPDAVHRPGARQVMSSPGGLRTCVLHPRRWCCPGRRPTRWARRAVVDPHCAMTANAFNEVSALYHVPSQRPQI